MKFIKTIRGGWQFTVEGQTFEAIRNIAGFTHRDWEIWTVKGGEQDEFLGDKSAIARAVRRGG
jgi:hypothetical protein